MKLGYYIHSKYDNYLKYSTNFTTFSVPPSPEEIVRQQKSQMLDTFRSQHNVNGYVLDIEKKLNFFYSTKSNALFQGNEAENILLQQKLTTYLESQIPELQKYNINWSDLSVTAKAHDPFKKTGTASGRTGVRLNTLTDKLYNLSLAITQTNIHSPDLLNKINSFFSQYSTIIRNIQTEANSMTTSSGSIVSFSELGGKPLSATELQDTNKINFITALNQLDKEVQRINAQQVLGDIAEQMTKILPYLYESATKRTATQLIDDFELLMKTNNNLVVGKQRSAKVIDSSSVLGGKSLQRRSIVGYHEARLWSTQDKVDVVINVGSHRNINASVKNYGAKSSNIHLLSGTSLIKFLQLYPIFGNHYLNITAVNDDDPSRNASNRAYAQKTMHEQLLKILAFHALTGGLIGRYAGGIIQKTPQAEVLIVNQRSRDGKGQFRVYSMSEIYDKIDKNVNLLSVTISGTKNGAGPRDIALWPNQWVGNPSTPNGAQSYGRIYTILSYLHASELKVQLKVAALR